VDGTPRLGTERLLVGFRRVSRLSPSGNRTRPAAGAHEPSPAWEELFADCMAFCLPLGHPLADEDELELVELAGECSRAL
jgi:hypothetical protein